MIGNYGTKPGRSLTQDEFDALAKTVETTDHVAMGPLLDAALVSRGAPRPAATTRAARGPCRSSNTRARGSGR